jgi:hypothetical protein
MEKTERTERPARPVRKGRKKVCAFCEYSAPAPSDMEGNEYVICSKKGLVRDGYVCRKFSYDPLKREPSVSRALPETEAVNIDEL